MKDALIKWIGGLVVAVSQAVSAVPITDTVIVGSQEWAQVDLFTNVSWDTFNTQCPAGACSSASVVNGYDLAGWRWASIDAVQTLFNYFTGVSTTAPGVYTQYESTWAPRFVSYFRPTVTAMSVLTVGGWASSPGSVTTTAYSPRVDDWRTWEDIAYTGYLLRTEIQSYQVGAWVVRDAAPAPAPATLALFSLGLASLWVTRRKRGAKV